MMRNAGTLGTVHTHIYTLCLLRDENLILLDLISVAEKLYIKYEEIKVDMQLLHRQTVF